MAASSNVTVSHSYASRFVATLWASLAQLVRAPSHSRRAEARRRSARHVLWLSAGIGALIIALMYWLDAAEIGLMPPRGTASLWWVRILTDFGKAAYVLWVLAALLFAVLIISAAARGTTRSLLLGLGTRLQFLFFAVLVPVLAGEVLKWAVGRGPRPRLLFGQFEFGKRAAQMHGRRPSAFRRFPRNRAVQRPVHFEHAHAIPVSLETAAVGRRQPRAGDFQERTRRQVAQHRSRARQFVERGDAMICDHLSSEHPQVRNQRIGQLLRAAARYHPPDHVRHHAQHETEAGGQRLVERHEAVCGDAAKQGPRALLRECAVREPRGGPQRPHPERRHREGMLRPPKRAEH